MFKNLCKKVLSAAIAVSALTVLAAPPHDLDALPDSDFWVIRKFHENETNPKNRIRFLKLNNRGKYGKDYKYSGRKPDRPIPRPEMKKDYPRPGIGTIKDEKIPLELLDESGVPRNAAEVRVGVPFPKGGLFSLKNLRVENEKGNNVPAHFDLLSKWPDGSMRFVLVSFSANVDKNQKKVWTLRAGTAIRRPEQKPRVVMNETENEITVSTPVLKAVIDKKKFNIFKAVSFYSGADKKFHDGGTFSADGIVLVDAAGKKLASTVTPPDEITVEEQGGERLALRISGILGEKKAMGNIRYIVRLYFKSTTPTVKANIQIVNADLERQLYDFNEVYLDYQPAFKVNSIALSNGGVKNVHSGSFIRQYEHAKFASGSVKNMIDGKLDDWIAVMGTGKDQRVAVGWADFAERWPKGVAVVNGAVRFELLPPLPGVNYAKNFPTQLIANFCEGKYRHYWGTAFMEQLFFDFSNGSFNAAGAEAGRPIIAVIPPAWYERCDLLHGANVELPAFDERINEMLANIKISQEKDQETGYFNYGDWYGERSVNWGNNEYDTGYLYWQLFARTGNRDFFRLAMAAARHQANTDTAHASPDARQIGGDHYHGIGHVGSADYTPAYQVPNKKGFNGRANNGHTWVRSLLTAWNLAGETAAYEAALMIAEQLRYQAYYQRVMASAVRVTAWQLFADCAMYENDPTPEYLCAATEVFNTQYREQDFEHGGIWAKPKPRIPGKRPGQTIFMLGVGGQSMVAYHRITGDPRAKKSIVAIAKWVAESFHPVEYAFYYDRSWDLKYYNPLLVGNMTSYVGGVVMYAALLTDDAKLKEVADKMLAIRLYRGFGVKKDMNMSLLYLGEWLAYRKEWLRLHPEDKFTFDRETFRQKYLKVLPPAFHARNSGSTGVRFAIQLKAPEAEVVLLRNLVGKGRDVVLKVTDAAGKVVVDKTYADSELSENRIPVKLFGKAGDLFFIDINSQSAHFWNIAITDKFAAFLRADKETMARRPQLRRYYFTVPEGTKEFKVRLFAWNPGFISAAVRTPDGKLFKEFEHTNINRFSGNPDSEFGKNAVWYNTIKNPVPGLWSVDFAVEIDGAISFEGIPSWYAVTPDKLPAGLK